MRETGVGGGGRREGLVTFFNGIIISLSALIQYI